MQRVSKSSEQQCIWRNRSALVQFSIERGSQNLLWTHSASPRESTTFWPLWWRISLSTRIQTTLNHIRLVKSKGIRNYFGFAPLLTSIGSKNSHFFSINQPRNKNQSRLGQTSLPPLALARCICFLFPWFIVLLPFVMVDESDLGFGVTTIKWRPATR